MKGRTYLIDINRSVEVLPSSLDLDNDRSVRTFVADETKKNGEEFCATEKNLSYIDPTNVIEVLTSTIKEERGSRTQGQLLFRSIIDLSSRLRHATLSLDPLPASCFQVLQDCPDFAQCCTAKAPCCILLRWDTVTHTYTYS